MKNILFPLGFSLFYLSIVSISSGAVVIDLTATGTSNLRIQGSGSINISNAGLIMNPGGAASDQDSESRGDIAVVVSMSASGFEFSTLKGTVGELWGDSGTITTNIGSGSNDSIFYAEYFLADTGADFGIANQRIIPVGQQPTDFNSSMASFGGSTSFISDTYVEDGAYDEPIAYNVSFDVTVQGDFSNIGGWNWVWDSNGAITGGETITVSGTFIPVPEPSSGLLLGLACSVTLLKRRRL